jgi:hypothetical protein
MTERDETPYSYNAHINVECVMSLAAAKYITKYTHKGVDRATVEIQCRNKVSDLRDCQYIGASEASWRIFKLPIHHQQPAVMSLQVHLPGQHMVVFNTNDTIEEVTAQAEQENTMLTSFFTLNRDNELAREYTYQELPLHFVWNKRHKIWTPRKTGGTISHLYFVSPIAGEHFYLQTLLTTVQGPTDWTDLQTYDGQLYPTFHTACLARSLLEDDDEWRQCLEEASLTHVGESMRCLFSLILRNCFPSQPDVLWIQFRDNLCDDLQRKLRRKRRPTGDIPQADVYDYSLFLIEKDLHHHGFSLACFPSMPIVQKQWDDSSINKYIVEQLAYDTEKEKLMADRNIALLNNEQRSAFNQIDDAIRSENGRGFFLHGGGGTGKTFLYQTLCHSVRSDTLIALCAASSGIASLLLPGGRTAHSTFSIPVEFLDDKSSCAVNKKGKKADMFRSVRLIIWDEAVTQHRYVFAYYLPFVSIKLQPKFVTAFTDSLLKQSIVCCRTFDQTHAPLEGFASFSVGTFNKHSLWSRKERVPTLFTLLYKTVPYGNTSPSFTFDKTCAFSDRTTLFGFRTGYLTSDTEHRNLLTMPTVPSSSLNTCSLSTKAT